MMLYQPVELMHYDNQAILDHPVVSQMTNDAFNKPWNLLLFDLKSVLPDFYEWCEDHFKSRITVTRFFITRNNESTLIHHDLGYKWSLNIPVYNCLNNYNYWYVMKDSADTVDMLKKDSSKVNFVANDGGAARYNHDDVVSVIDKLELKQPMLFNADIPHNVVTGELEDPNKPRIVLSVRTESMRRDARI